MAENPRKRLPRGKTLATAEAVAMARRSRYNPVRGLTMVSLANALDSFEAGDLKAASLLWETIAQRDDTLVSVKPKREKDVSLREWQVIAADKSPEAQAHQETLQKFWDNARATSAYDRNRRGGVRLLVRQMMEAVSYRYAVHHILWHPTPAGLRATFEHVPLWFFENRTGQLRFLQSGTGIEGVEMDPLEWLTHCGDGLMIAASIGYAAKRVTYQDWMTFSEKFAMPGVLGKTSAAKGSPEGEAMKSAVESFGNDWAAVIYGSDGTSNIDLIQANGSSLALPMPALIERVDRKIAAMYRGADLSTMSAGSGEGSGASLQEEEGDIFLADDCESISETLRQIDRIVIEWTHGAGVEPMARMTLIPPVTEDKKFILQAAGELADRGARVSLGAVQSRLGIESVDADDPDDVPLGGKTQDRKTQDPRLGAANAETFSEWVERVRRPDREAVVEAGAEMLEAAARADMKPLADEIARVLALPDETFKKGIEELAAKLDGLVEAGLREPALIDAWEKILAAATANGLGGQPQ